MMKWLPAIGLFAVAFTTFGCGGVTPGPTVASLTKVSGTVQLDGQPMAEGEIAFSTPGGGPSLIKIKDGKFEGKTSAGDKRVEIRAYKPGQPIMMDGKPTGDPVPENYIPGRFNSESNLTAKIEPAGTKDLKFDAESK